MHKYFALTAWMLLAIFGLGTPPQQQVQPVAGVLTLNIIPGTTAFKVILSANVTSVVIQNPNPGAIISVIFTENATGGFTVAFGGNIANPCTVNTSANATTTCQFQYDATSNTWNGIGGGAGGGGVGASQNAWYASPNCQGLTNCSFVNANTHWVCDATVNNTSNIVTAPDGNFLNTAKVGQVVWAVNANCNNGNAALAIVETTILSVDSATQIHTVASSTQTNAGNTTLIWGTLDTPTSANCGTGTDNVNTAWQAALANGVPLFLPAGAGAITAGGAGGIMVECIEFVGPTAASASNPMWIAGPAWIIGTPNFNATTVPTGASGLLGSFFAVNNQVPNVNIARDLTYFCGGYNNWATGTTLPIINLNRGNIMNITLWGCGANNGTLSGITLSGPSTVYALMSYFAGQIACNSSNGGPQVVVFSGLGYCSGPTGLTLSGGGNITNSYGSFFQSFGGQAAVNLTGTNQTFNSYGDIVELDSGAASIGVRNPNSGSHANLFGTQVRAIAGIAPSNGLIYTGAGAVTLLEGTQISTPSGGLAFSGATTAGSVISLGGNIYSGTGTICATSTCSFYNVSADVNGTLCATGNFALTSGWGTSTVASVAANGNIQGCHVTITGAAGAAGPVLTWTYPAAPLLAPASCHLSGVSGTLTGVSAGTPGATTVAYTFTGTPSAQTYAFDVGCP